MNNLGFGFGFGFWRRICDKNKAPITKEHIQDYLILKQYQENIERQSNINAYRKKILSDVNTIPVLSKNEEYDKEPDKPFIGCELEENITFDIIAINNIPE